MVLGLLFFTTNFNKKWDKVVESGKKFLILPFERRVLLNCVFKYSILYIK